MIGRRTEAMGRNPNGAGFCRQRGRSSCSAQARGATTCCEHCHHHRPKCTPEDTIRGMERVMRTLLALPGDRHDQEMAHCPYAWGVSV